MLTPGKDSVVHNMQGTIYDPVIVGNYTYHRHAAITDQALLANAVWTIWREDNTTGQLVPPEVNSAPQADDNIGTSPENLTYWATV